MDVTTGQLRRLSAETLILLNYGARFGITVLEKTFESPLDSKEIKSVNPKGNQPEIFIGRMLKLKLQYFDHLMQRANSLEKILMLGNTEGKRRRWQKMRCLDSIINSMDTNLSKLQEIVEDRESWCAEVQRSLKESDMT